jgi:transcriptional regulator with XRE-family HTH domain
LCVAKKPYIIKGTTYKIASKIKQLRISAGYTSYENFALDADIDRKQYWRVESGANITIKTLIVILNKHKISLESFFKGL